MSDAIFQINMELQDGMFRAEPLLPAGAKFPYFDNSGKPIKKSDATRRDSVFSSTGFMKLWARAIDSVDHNEKGAFALVGRPVWPKITHYRFEDSTEELFGENIRHLTGFNFAVPLGDSEPLPIVVGLSFFDTRMAFVFYRENMLLKSRSDGKAMPVWGANTTYTIGGDYSEPDERLKNIRIPYPVQALYADTADFSYTLNNVHINIAVPSGWALGEGYITRPDAPHEVQRLGLTVFDWEGATALLKHTNNPFTLVARVLSGLAQNGFINPVEFEERIDETTQADLQKVGDVVSVPGYDAKGNERTFLQLAKFKSPEGLDSLVDAPKGYRWAVNIIGLIFLVDEKSGKFYAPHEVFQVIDKHGKVWMNEYQLERLKAMYIHQASVIKGLQFTYNSFAQEIDEIRNGRV